MTINQVIKGTHNKKIKANNGREKKMKIEGENKGRRLEN